MFIVVMLLVNYHDILIVFGFVLCVVVLVIVLKLIFGFEGILGEGIVGFGVVGWCWMGDLFGGWFFVCLVMSFGFFDVVIGGGVDMFVYEFVCNLMVYDG